MTSSDESMFQVSHLRLWGAVAVALWFLTFATGTLVPSCPYRRLLDPSLSPECKPVPENAAEGSAPRQDLIVDGSLQVVDVVAAVPPSTSRLLDAVPLERSWGLLAAALLTGAVSYSPCNLALLALAAGLIGGCASRLTWGDAVNERRDGEESATRESAPRRDSAERAARSESNPPVLSMETRLRYLQENPIASMCRGLVSYLFVLAGLLAFTPAPFESTTPDSYLRMAGLVSAVAFAVGYDPSRLSAFLNRLPVKTA
jgi:hypothetical protein